MYMSVWLCCPVAGAGTLYSAGDPTGGVGGGRIGPVAAAAVSHSYHPYRR